MGLQISPVPLQLFASEQEKKYVVAYGDTVYYGTTPNVSSSSFDGQLTEGVQFAHERNRWFVTAPTIAPSNRRGSARLEVYDRDELEERLDALEAGGVGSGGSGDIALAPTGIAGTDTATVLAAMIDGTRLDEGTYVCTATGLNLSTGVPCILKGQGSAKTTITFPSGANGTTGIDFGGTAAGSAVAFSLTAQANIKATTLTVSAANAVTLGLVDGDYVQLWSSLLWTTTVAQQAVQGEIVRVKSVNTGTGVITLYGGLSDTYLLADVARIRKLNMLDGCVIEGVKIVNSTPLTGTGSLMIQAGWTNNLRIRDLVCEDGEGAALQLNSSLNFDIDMKVRDLADDGANNRYGYGINLFGSTAHGKVTMYAERCRHAVTTGASRSPSTHLVNPVFTGVPRDIDIFGSAHETTSCGFDSHSEGEDLRYWVSSTNCAQAFQARAKNVKLMSHDFQNNADASYIAGTASGLRVFPGQTSRTTTGSATAWKVGNAANVVLDDVVFLGMMSTDDGSASMEIDNVTNLTIIDPVCINVGAGGGDCFYVGTTMTANSVRIINPTAINAFRLVNNQSGVTDAVHVFGKATLRNVSHVSQTTSEDAPMTAERRPTTLAVGTAQVSLVADGLTEALIGVRRDNYGASRDTFDRMMMDSSGVLWGGSGALTQDVSLQRRSAAQWGIVGELRATPTATNGVVISSKLAAETAVRWYMDASGKLWASYDGTTAISQHSSIISTGLQVDAGLTAANSFNRQRLLVTATPYAVVATDSKLEFSVASAVAVTLPVALSGRELVFTDVSAAGAATNNITITPNGAETINGAATYVINTNRGSVTLSGRTGVGWIAIGKF